MNATKLTSLAVAATIALGGAAPSAAAAKATSTGKHTVTKETYVYKQAGKIFDGTMFENQTFKVTRLSKSGKWAYGYAYGHVNRKAWIAADALTKKR